MINKWINSNDKKYDDLNYLLHLKYLKNISNRHNKYPTFQIRSRVIRRSKDKDDRVIKPYNFNEIKGTNKTMIENSYYKKEYSIIGESKDFNDQVGLYRKLQEDKILKENQQIKLQLRNFKNKNNSFEQDSQYKSLQGTNSSQTHSKKIIKITNRNKRNSRSQSYLPKIK